MFPSMGLKSLKLSSNLTTSGSGWKDELVVIEFLVTVRNGEHGLIVMMLSVTVWSRTDGWRVCWAVWRQPVSGKHESCQHYSSKRLIFLTTYLMCWNVVISQIQSINVWTRVRQYLPKLLIMMSTVTHHRWIMIKLGFFSFGWGVPHSRKPTCSPVTAPSLQWQLPTNKAARLKDTHCRKYTQLPINVTVLGLPKKKNNKKGI